MKNRKYKNRRYIVAIAALVLTACIVWRTISPKNAPDIVRIEENADHRTILDDARERMAILNNSTPYQTIPMTKNKDTYIMPVDAELKQTDNTLHYGALCITLLDVKTVLQPASETDDKSACVIDLVGAEQIRDMDGCYGTRGPLPPRLWLSHYGASYENEWQLASLLLDILPDTTLRFCDNTGDKLHYLFTYEKPYKNGYVLVCGSDVCIVEEVSAESDYSFDALLKGGWVHWDNTMQRVDTRDRNEVYIEVKKCKTEQDGTLLAAQTLHTDGTRRISLYRDGHFMAPFMEYSFAKCPAEIGFEDYNFDGSMDMIAFPKESPTTVLLWNTDKKTFEAAQMPEEFPTFSWDFERYPETKTIWSYDTDYVVNADGATYWNRYDNTETLWQWEGTTLTKKRECTAQVREEAVRICAYAYHNEDKTVLYDEIVPIAEWEQNSDAVQVCYRKFYEGALSTKNAGRLHKVDYKEEAIPQGLSDSVSEAILESKENVLVDTLGIGKELTKEKVLAIAKDNLSLRYDVVLAEPAGDYTMLLVDGDNDGISDIVAEIYYGGTGGYTEYVFYQGQEDGTFEKTCTYDAVHQNFIFIRYDEKNYLCRRLYDYDTKEYSGISLTCYVDGVQAETWNLMFAPESYDFKITECASKKYRTLAEETLENSGVYKEKIDQYADIIGSAEEKLPLGKHEYRCDLNNDDALEQYEKSVWTPSNLAMREYIHFSGKDTGTDASRDAIQAVEDAIQTVEGFPIMMWADLYENKTIVHVISRTGLEHDDNAKKPTGLDDFAITAFLIEGTRTQTVYKITADAVYTIREEYDNNTVQR